MIRADPVNQGVSERKPRASGDDPYVAPNTTEITV